MDCYVNKTSGLKEEGQHIRESTVATKDIPSHRTIGEGRWEDKEEEVDNNTTLPPHHHP